MYLELLRDIAHVMLFVIAVIWVVAYVKWQQFRRHIQQRIDELDRELKRNETDKSRPPS